MGGLKINADAEVLDTQGNVIPGLYAAGGARRRCSRLRCCSNPPTYVSLTFVQKKTASVSLHQRFFHGRGWITQAALLKTA